MSCLRYLETDELTTQVLTNIVQRITLSHVIIVFTIQKIISDTKTQDSNIVKRKTPKTRA